MKKLDTTLTYDNKPLEIVFVSATFFIAGLTTENKITSGKHRWKLYITTFIGSWVFIKEHVFSGLKKRAIM